MRNKLTHVLFVAGFAVIATGYNVNFARAWSPSDESPYTTYEGITQSAVIDRIVDGEHAVLLVGESEKEVILPAENLPEGAKEGNWLELKLQITEIRIDAERTQRVSERVKRKRDKLRQRGRGHPPIESGYLK